MMCGQKRLRQRHDGSGNTHIGDVFGKYKMSAANLSSSKNMEKGVRERHFTLTTLFRRSRVNPI
jgi:hypothetical protein